MFCVCDTLNFPSILGCHQRASDPHLSKDLRLFYVLDSFCGQLWLVQDGTEIVLSDEIAEDVVLDILLYRTSEE